MPNGWKTINIVSTQNFDFTVDEGKERLNPSREKNEGTHRGKKVDGKSCVTFLLCDPGWCCVVFFFPSILDIKFVGRTSRGHTAGGRSHRISHPPSFCGACLNFSREKDSAVPFPRRP